LIIGALGVGYSFYSAPKTIEDAKEIIASQHDSHGAAASHDVVKTDAHTTEDTNKTATHNEVKTDDHSSADTTANDEHAEHVLHALQNKPWAATYVALFFFLGITLLVLAFYAIQRVAQAGWSVVLFRVMEAITANIVPASILMFVVIMTSVGHLNHMFTWMGEGVFDTASPNYDAIVDGKKWWLNVPGWVMRSTFYFIRKNSIAEDTANDGRKTYKRSYHASVIFLVFFMITESMMSWDWIMGLDPHWFSTLFGWYVLATLLVSALTVIAFVTIYLRSKGHLPFVNDSHIHDLAKYMFGFSVFWTYLWFSQFMLIWYADMSEETVYFIARFNDYKTPFLGMVVMNFVFPILLLINSDYKSKPWFVVIGGLVILTGHYIDVFVMIMPATVGDQWSIGIPELSAISFFIGLFIFVTFRAFSKAAPLATGNPFLHESEHFHYYNIEHEGEENHHH
jgi:hypothetical protein